MAQSGNKVLLVEGDLRRPVIGKVFGIDQIPGFQMSYWETLNGRM